MGENDQAQRSIIDYMHIVKALEDRDADLAEGVSHGHSWVLAAPVAKNVTYGD